ncbi:hypothetical protein [Microlunatus parietis]|uniref:Arsenate reductase n=1 Tax=Microlunatus parietis TaxID=682979 RepID=A0A7Y9L7R0_9ACTN|nr:hypothetical protein [Microlunatus parietis]NYE70019.1 hypothetical protein [Microlunatus parietis]
MTNTDPGWAPDSCTLPTVEQPLRVAEFDALFADALRSVERVDAVTARLILAGEAAGTARDLAAREVECCSFFRFEVDAADPGRIGLLVSVPPARAAVLDAVVTRAVAAAGLAG